MGLRVQHATLLHPFRTGKMALIGISNGTLRSQLQVHPENMGTLICSSQKCVCIYIYLYNQVSAIVLIPCVLIKSLIRCLTKSHSLMKLCCFQKNWWFIPKFLSQCLNPRFLDQ